ncbi:unnamed protein product [Closterium sp. Yama58-4]|nr:unnamed protein product [Closterium sp. Yama58-4]
MRRYRLVGSEVIEVRPTVAGDASDAGGVTWMEVELLARGGARAQDRFGFGSLKGDGWSENVETLATSGEKGASEKGETGEVVGSSGISAVDSIDLVDFKNLVVHAAIDLPDFILLLLRPLAAADPSKSDVAAGYISADASAASGKRSSEGVFNGIFRNARFGRARVSQQQLERIKEMQCSFGKEDKAGGRLGGSVVWQALNHKKRPPPQVYDAVTVRRGERRGGEGREGRGRGSDGREEKGETVEGEEREEREGREGVYLFVRGLQTNPHQPPVLANVTCVFGADGGRGGAGAGGSGGEGERGSEGGSGSEGAEQVGLLRVPARAAAMEVVFCPLPAHAGSDGGTANSSSSHSGRDGTGVGAAAGVADLAMRAVTVEYEGRLFPSVALFDPVDPFDQPEAPHGQQDGEEGSNGLNSSDGRPFGDVLNAGNGSSTNVWTKHDAGVEAAEGVGGSSVVGQSGLNGIVEEGRRRKGKPHFVCVCTMIFNVGKFLREWVVYHHWMGVDRIFLYDNNSEDNTTAVSQQAGFSHCVLRAARQCEWVGFIDVDEFVAPKFIAHIAERRKGLGGEVREKGVFIPHLLRKVKGKGKGSEGDKSNGKQAKKKKAKGEVEEEEEEEEEKGEGTRKRGMEKEEKTKKRNKGTGDIDSKSSMENESERAEDDVRPLGQISFPCVDFGPSGLTEHPQQGVSVGYTCRARKPDRHKSFVRPEAVADSLLCHIHQFELKEERYRSQVFSGRVRLANINHYKFQVWDEFKAKYRRRVATYTKDWKGAKQNSNDLIPGLGTDAVEPPDWAGRFCERNDTVLRDFVKLAFAVKDGKGRDGRNRTCLVWE